MIKVFSGRAIALFAALSLALCSPAYAGLKAVAGGTGGGPTVNSRCPNLTTTQCAKLIGYAVATEFGAKCDGVTNDSVALAAAAASGYPVLIQGTCAITLQVKATADNWAFFAFPNATTYDTSSQTGYRGTLRVNNSNGLFTGACAFDMNLHPITFENVNIQGDYIGTGTVALCNSVAYSSGTLPWLNLRHVTITNFDNGMGYAINASTGLPTGTLGDNLIEINAYDLTLQENAWPMYGNFSDADMTDIKITGNDCGGAYFSGGGQGNHLSQARNESNAAHSYAPCSALAGTIGAGFTFTGINNTLAGNCENNAGPCVELTGAWGGFSFLGYMKGNASAARAGYDADVIYNGNGSSTGGASITAIRNKVGSAPKYAQKFKTANDNHIYNIGGTGGSGAYGTSFSDVSAFNPTDVTIDVPGETTYQMGQSTINNIGTSFTIGEQNDQFGLSTFTLESRVGVTGGLLHVANGLPADFVYNPGSLQANFRLEPRNGSVVNTGNSALGEWEGIGDVTGTPTIEWYAGKNAAGFPATMDAGPTKFTTSGCSVSATTGGSTTGTYTSGTTGACTVVITMNGATGVTATTGWSCYASDRTTPADLITQTASSTTTATLAGTTVSGDVISFGCKGY